MATASRIDLFDDPPWGEPAPWGESDAEEEEATVQAAVASSAAAVAAAAGLTLVIVVAVVLCGAACVETQLTHVLGHLHFRL